MATKVDQVFVMRFWQENGSVDPSDPSRWRAQIKYVNSRKQFYSAGLERAFGLVRAMLLDEDGLSREKHSERKHS